MVKPKKRYILFQIQAEAKPFTLTEARKAVYRGFQELFGVIGLSHAGLALVHFDEKTQRGIIRCNHTHVSNVRAALAFTHQSEEGKVSFATQKVSGAVSKLKVQLSERLQNHP